MRVSDFDYDLPERLIAQNPAEHRDMSRLMLLDRSNGNIEGKLFRDIVDYLFDGDLLVLNDTKVIPARLSGMKAVTGGKVEILLLKEMDTGKWEAMVKPGRRLRTGDRILIGNCAEVVIGERLEDGKRLVEFPGCSVWNIMEKYGKTPLPPYIKTDLKDSSRYQTVYALRSGSAAAPTAGFHFTPELMDALRAKGVNFATITLHIGPGTFRPVLVDDITAHKMHKEYYFLSEETEKAVVACRTRGGRVIAVGTTSVRTLEQSSDQGRGVIAGAGETGLFIYPGYKYKVVDAMITNFHLPRSTLLMLVSAFSGYEYIMRAYTKAVQEEYRFFSFGDAMFIH